MFNLSQQLKIAVNHSNVKQKGVTILKSFVSKQSKFCFRMAHSDTNGYANKRVLAIQSHVVHGYVGNKSATFPLQVYLILVCKKQINYFANYCFIF